MKKAAIFCWALACVLSLSVQAQEAPAPRKMPRVPVTSQTVMQQHDQMPASRQVEGQAAIIDGEKLRVGETDLRLFGIVPPQLAASFGPQARADLDALAGGQNVTCQIRDRDRDGRLLAVCRNAKDIDMSLDLLKRGLAVTARGSIAGTELATPYLAAEQAAQNQKIGLWSVSAAPAASVAIVAAPAPAPKAETAPAETPPHTDKTVAAAEKTIETQAKIAADVVAQNTEQETQARTQARIDDAAWAQEDSVGFFERYQILIAGFLALATALSIMGALGLQKRGDRLDEIKAVAAALRGELMAARAVCLGRSKSITSEAEDQAAAWPRIRATLYQAYVGRLGVLGAELARQISSVYGQSSDYAALYNQTGAAVSAPKKQALETLIKHIDAILPRLAQIEQSGSLSATTTPRSYRPATPTPRHLITQAGAPIPPEPAASPSAPVAEAKAETPSAPPASAAEPFEAADPAAAPTPRPQSPALWEAVRGFIQSHRNAIAEPVQPEEQHIAEYAEMIEADMARYQYGSAEILDISPQKKQG